MDVNAQTFSNCISSILACVILGVTFVASLYVWNSPLSRDHPSVIKKRFLSIFFMMFISPMLMWLFLRKSTFQKNTLFELLGLRLPGVLQASTIPLILTMILFLGPLTILGVKGIKSLFLGPKYWVSKFKNLVWLRNYIIAPFSEELTFRACMLPLLLECFQPITAVVICPLFFGTAHFHHLVEKLYAGVDLKQALLSSFVQFLYTTLFGAYSAYLFVRTGHFISSFLAHAFCNIMGLPDLIEILSYPEPRRTFHIIMSIVGLLSWCFLLAPLTSPVWYSNNLFWSTNLR